MLQLVAQSQPGFNSASHPNTSIPAGHSKLQPVMWVNQPQTVPVMSQPVAHPVDSVQYFVPGTADVATTQVHHYLMGAFAYNGDAQPQPTSGGAVKDNRDGRSVDDVTCRTPPRTEYRATSRHRCSTSISADGNNTLHNRNRRRSQSARRIAPAAEEEPEGWQLDSLQPDNIPDTPQPDRGRARVCATATGRHRRQGNQRLIQTLGYTYYANSCDVVSPCNHKSHWIYQPYLQP